MSLNCGFGSIISHMVIDMDETRLQTISQLQAFLAGTVEVRFGVPDNDEARYAHIVSVAQRFGYARLNRPDKGVVLRYLIAKPQSHLPPYPQAPPPNQCRTQDSAIPQSRRKKSPSRFLVR